MPDLTFLELFPLLVAIHIWMAEFCNSTVSFWCDNQTVVYVVDKETSRLARVMHLVQVFVLQCLQVECTVCC